MISVWLYVFLGRHGLCFHERLFVWKLVRWMIRAEVKKEPSLLVFSDKRHQLKVLPEGRFVSSIGLPISPQVTEVLIKILPSILWKHSQMT